MNDYISRAAAIDAMGSINDSICEQQAIDALYALPSADAVEVRRGHWGSKGDCSECGCQPWYERDIHSLRYCPNCGARMDGEQDG